MSWRSVSVSLVLGLSVTVGSWLCRAQRGPEPPRELAASLRRASAEVGRFRGAASCSPVGCHGRVAEAGTLGSEFNTWFHLDPHTNAYVALFDARSHQISRSLYGHENAHRVPLCLSCHGRPDPGAVSDLTRLDGLESLEAEAAAGFSGVTCEACHGPAGGWIEAHATPDWEHMNDREKTRRGMNVLQPSEAKARRCAACHVGSGLEQQVNHDLIAAGHPRLAFAFANYAERLPRHWSEAEVAQDRRARGIPPRTEAGEWAVGQLVTLQATMELLRERASAHPKAPWPEFTEYGCFACHHRNLDRGLRYSRGLDVPGALPWRTWEQPLALLLLEAEDSGAAAELRAIEGLMSEPWPEPELVEERAGNAIEALDRTLEAFDEGLFHQEDLLDILEQAVAAPEATLAHWDALAQFGLAARLAFEHELKRLRAEGAESLAPERIGQALAVSEALDELDAWLIFPEGTDSPGPDREPDPDPSRPSDVWEVCRTVVGRLERLRAN